jgi:hypothetical protein
MSKDRAAGMVAAALRYRREDEGVSGAQDEGADRRTHPRPAMALRTYAATGVLTKPIPSEMMPSQLKPMMKVHRALQMSAIRPAVRRKDASVRASVQKGCERRSMFSIGKHVFEDAIA